MRQNVDGYNRTACYICNISHGSVATFLRCDGNFRDDCTANSLLRHAVKEFWKLANIWREYDKKFVCTTCYVDSISQGSVATLLRCGGMFNDGCIERLLLKMSVKEICKLISIWWCSGKKLVVTWVFYKVVTRLKCSEIFTSDCIADVLLRAPVKEF